MSKTVEGKHEMFDGKNTRNLSVNLNCLFFKMLLFFGCNFFSRLILIQLTQFFQWQFKSTRFLLLMKHFFLLCNRNHGKWESGFFSLSLLNTETSSFNTIMQLINPNYAWKNRVKQIKTTQFMRSKCSEIQFFCSSYRLSYT